MDIESELLRLYEGRGYFRAIANRYSHENQEDLVQEAFLQAWKGRSQFRGGSSVKTWFAQIVVNVCLQWLRKEIRDNKRLIMCGNDIWRYDVAIPSEAEGRVLERELLTIAGTVARRIRRGQRGILQGVNSKSAYKNREFRLRRGIREELKCRELL